MEAVPALRWVIDPAELTSRAASVEELSDKLPPYQKWQAEFIVNILISRCIIEAYAFGLQGRSIAGTPVVIGHGAAIPDQGRVIT